MTQKRAAISQMINEAAGMELDRSSPVPLYAQIKEALKALINKLDPPPERFFTDEELTQVFGVSRTTVREAVRELIQEGFLYRIRGLGTFVGTPAVVGDLASLRSYFEDWAAQGKDVSVRITAYRWDECPAWAQADLRLPSGEQTFFIHRLRFVDGTPISSDYRYLPKTTAVHILRQELFEKTILEICAEKMPADPPSSASFTIQAENASADDAEWLGIGTGDAVLVRSHVLLSRRGAVLSVGRSVFRGDLTKWSITLPAKPSSKGGGLV